MPVRVYDIAKKLGLENKEILAKAKEMGIAAAKVPSSSLDKITAEWLEEEIIRTNPAVAARLTAKPAEEKPKPAVVEEPVVVIHAPEPPATARAGGGSDAGTGGRGQRGSAARIHTRARARVRAGVRARARADAHCGRAARGSAARAQTSCSSRSATAAQAASGRLGRQNSVASSALAASRRA